VFVDAGTKSSRCCSLSCLRHIFLPMWIIRGGALSNLGIPCIVSADISNLPAYELNPGTLATVQVTSAL